MECSDEQPIPFYQYYCYKDIKFKAFVDSCGCVPFSFRNFLVTDDESTISYYQGLPYCTSKMYNRCLESYRNQPSPLPLCRHAKNAFSVSITSFKGIVYQCINIRGRDFNKTCSRVSYRFSCPESIYAFYEERFKLSLSQFLSQIGGDLGLYTGISLLGLWQFLAFAYTIYRNYRKAQMNSDNTLIGETPVNPVQKVFSALLFHYLEEMVKTTPALSDNQQMAMTDVSDSQMVAWKHQVDEQSGVLTETVAAMKEQQHRFQNQQHQFQNQMSEMLHLISSLHNKVGAIQNYQAEVAITDL